MRIALITDQMKMEYPDLFKDTYKESLNTVSHSIADAIESLGYEVKHIKAGEGLLDKITRFNPHLVFNRSNLEKGQEGIAETPELLDSLGIPYTGPNGKNCVIAFNKFQTKKILKSLGIATPAFLMVSDMEDVRIPEEMAYPLFVKPVTGGCSLGIESENIVFEKEACKAICEHLINTFDRPVIVEEFLGGREFTVGLLGNEALTALPILEFVHAAEDAYAFRSFTTKMIPGKKEEKTCPAVISKEEENAIIALAKKTYHAIGCRDYARVDIRFDGENRPHVLEVNAFPSLKPDKSSFAVMAKIFGLPFEDLIKEILTIALKRNQINQNVVDL